MVVVDVVVADSGGGCGWLLKFVKTYVIHLLGTYATILCNWLIF